MSFGGSNYVAFNHLVGRLEASIGDFSQRELFMVSLLSRNDWSIGDKGEMDPWAWSQVFVNDLQKEQFLGLENYRKLVSRNMRVVSISHHVNHAKSRKI